MSEACNEEHDKTEDNTSLTEAPTKRIWRRIKRPAAFALAIAITAGVVNEVDNRSLRTANKRIATIAAQAGKLAGVDSKTILRESLRSPIELSGTTHEVTPAQKELQQQSTLVLFRRQKNSKQSWNPVCTATKVSVGIDDYALTAAHCLNYSFVSPNKSEAVNALPFDSNEYMVASPSAVQTKGNATTIHGSGISPITAISILSEPKDPAPDLALLKVTSTPAFKRQSTIPFEQMLHGQPIPGEQVALYSVPSSVTLEPVAEQGTYLGRIKTPPLIGEGFSSTGLLDVVGLKNLDARHDSCEHGGSGSSFVAASGFISGPVSYRTGNLQERGKPHDAFDQIYEAAASRLELEQYLDQNTDAYSVLCSFAVLPPNSGAELISGLSRNLK